MNNAGIIQVFFRIMATFVLKLLSIIEIMKTPMATKRAVLIILGILMIIVCLYLNKMFNDKLTMEKIIAAYGCLAPLLFVILQIIQVIIPLIPGGASSALGAVLFGPFYGFIYNYIGIISGSLLAFILTKRYRRSFILKFVKPETMDKYIAWLDEGRRFELFFCFSDSVARFPG